MSIYVTGLWFGDDEHDLDACAQYIRTPTNEGHVVVYGDGERRYYRRDQSKPCTCHRPPLTYQGSHILPSDADPRGGVFDLGEIPGFISRAGRVLCGEDDDCDEPATVCCKRVWPWLRVAVGETSVVLDYRQVAEVHEYLTGWLERAQPHDKETN